MLDAPLVAGLAGLALVVASHAWSLLSSTPLMTMKQHSLLNLLAAALLAFYVAARDWPSGWPAAT